MSDVTYDYRKDDTGLWHVSYTTSDDADILEHTRKAYEIAFRTFPDDNEPGVGLKRLGLSERILASIFDVVTWKMRDE